MTEPRNEKYRSLSRLRREAGFKRVEVKSAHESSTPDWPHFELDVRQGAVYDPASLFMEANKPA
jgi:hypothetical protein